MSDTTPNQSSPDTTPVTSDPTTSPEVVADTTSVTTVEVEPTVLGTETVSSATAASPMSTVTPWYRRPVVVQYGIAFLIVALMGGGLLYILEAQGRVQTTVFKTIGSMLIAEPSVATVNGEKITQSQYDKSRDQLLAQAAAQGLDPANPSITEQINTEALDILVNTELLRQAAVAGGVNVTDEQVAERYAEIVASQGGEEQLQTRMTELGITKDSLETDIRGEILIQTHLSNAIDTSAIVVSESDITAFYESVASTAGAADDIPPLAEVRDQIEQQLRVTQEQRLVTEYIESLKTDATIVRN